MRTLLTILIVWYLNPTHPMQMLKAEMNFMSPTIELSEPFIEPEISVWEDINVCHNGKNKSYMDYRKITNKNSTQYKYIRDYMTAVEGLLLDEDGYIGVALGSYFGDIGNRYIFTLDTGVELKVVKVEAKADNHTNNGCEQRWDKSVIEFVIDNATNQFFVGSNGYIAHGNFNNLEQFKGEIVSIKKEIKT